MITKIQGEQPFQVLTNNFSISPSNEGYTLQISADGKQYSNLFSVGAGVTRLVTGVAANSYYRLLGNQSQVSINWMKTCVTEGGAAGNELIPQESLPENADPGTVVALSDGGVYQYDGSDWNEVGADDFSAYWTSAETKTYVDSADTIIYNSATTHIEDVERIMSSALNEFHTQIVEVSGDVQSLSAVTTGMSGNLNALSGSVQSLSAATTSISANVQTISGDVISLSASTTGISANLNALSGATTGIAANVQTVSGDVISLSAATTGLSGNLNSLSAATTGIASDVQSLSGDVQSISADVATIDTVVSAAIVELDTKKVESTSVHTIWKGTQAEYDLIQTKDPATLYVII